MHPLLDLLREAFTRKPSTSAVPIKDEWKADPETFENVILESAKEMDPQLLKDLNFHISRLKSTSLSHNRGLPSANDVVERVAGWERAEEIKNFVSKDSYLDSNQKLDFRSKEDLLKKRLETEAARGCQEATQSLRHLALARQNYNDPVAWVEIVVDEKLSTEKVDRILKSRNNAYVQWSQLNDNLGNAEPLKIELPLMYWDTQDEEKSRDEETTGRVLGHVSDQDEPGMKDRLQRNLDRGVHGGLAATTSPIGTRPDGKRCFFALLNVQSAAG